MPFRISKSAVVFLASVFLLVLLAAYGVYLVKQKAQREDSALAQIQKGELPYTDLDGNIFNLEQYRGSVLIVNAWASWSPFSIDELRMLSELKSKYGNEVNVVAINRKEDAAVAKAFIAHIGNPSGITYLLDGNDTFFTSVGGYAMPETVVYDKRGNVLEHRRGALSKSDLEGYVANALAAE